MKPAARRALIAAGVAAAALLLLGFRWVRQRDQLPDPDFHPAVPRPAFAPGAGPRVVVDEAHRNFHRAGGRYRPFAELLARDGFRVASSGTAFDRASLRDADVLVIVNAMGARWPFLPGAGDPAFTDAECDAVRDWVRDGGSLLLVADHAPVGSASAGLARRFGVEMGGGRTVDYLRGDSATGNPSWVVYTPENGGLAAPAHPVIAGRDSAERVRRVMSFLGQSLKGPPGSTTLLALSDSAVDLLAGGTQASAAGRAQGVALELGKGRVVVLGEAAMLTAQVTGGGRLKFGMNHPGAEGNAQLALNVVRWLGRKT